ncbi:30S ribosomal protein S4E [uncultured archaeon]|nr:30S ribosomal protein S4E [uncultured archaeon]
MHIKRHTIPKSWPVPRKGVPYVVKPNFEFERGMPLLVVLRDVLKVAGTAKEIQHIVNERGILVNTKPVKDVKHGVLLFDTITFVKTKKSYRMEMDELGKFEFKEIKENESNKKISKVVNKTLLKGKKVQINMSDGRNILSNEKCKTNDSALINLNTGKIEKILPLKEKAEVLIFEGKHAGEKGAVISIDDKKKMVDIQLGKEKTSILIKQVIVTA